MPNSAPPNVAAPAGGEKPDALERMLEKMRRDMGNGGKPPPIDPPDGADDNDGMDSRVANLEAFAADAKERLARVETQLDHIAKEISNAKWFVLGGVLTIIVTVITTIVATGVGIQQMTVTTFEAAGKASASGTAQPIVIQIPAVPPAPQPEK